MDQTNNSKSTFPNGRETIRRCSTFANFFPTDTNDNKQLSLHEKVILDIGILKCKLGEIEEVISNIEDTLLKNVVSHMQQQ